MLVGKVALLSALVLVIVAAGVWTSWKTAQHVMLAKGRERGTMTVSACGEKTCTGPFRPTTGFGSDRSKVTIDKSVTHRTGERIPVAVEPGTDDVVRTGWGGVLHAWIPLAGSLLLAALVLGWRPADAPYGVGDRSGGRGDAGRGFRAALTAPAAAFAQLLCESCGAFTCQRGA